MPRGTYTAPPYREPDTKKAGAHPMPRPFLLSAPRSELPKGGHKPIGIAIALHMPHTGEREVIAQNGNPVFGAHIQQTLARRHSLITVTVKPVVPLGMREIGVGMGHAIAHRDKALIAAIHPQRHMPRCMARRVDHRQARHNLMAILH